MKMLVVFFNVIMIWFFKRCFLDNSIDFFGVKIELKELGVRNWDKVKENEVSYGVKWYFSMFFF